MKLKEIPFKNNAAKRIYLNYMKRVKKTIRQLDTDSQFDTLQEINSHIYEGISKKENQNEIDSLLDVLDKLGEPEKVLKPLIADRKLDQATKSFNPFSILNALILNFTNGISYLIFFILYLGLFGFVFLIFAKTFNPEGVGLFFKNGHFLALGKINPEYLQQTNYTEVLSHWFIPVMILSILFFYILITLLLKLKRSLNKK